MSSSTEPLKTNVQVEVKNTDLFAYKACDLLIIPCSDAGTISEGFNNYLYSYGISSFSIEEKEKLHLGNVIPIKSSHKPPLALAVTVTGRSKTKPLKLFEIGNKIAQLAKEFNYDTIACPLLGTGAGGVAPFEAYEMLAKGFERSASKKVKLIICIPDATIYKLVQLGQTIHGQENSEGTFSSDDDYVATGYVEDPYFMEVEETLSASVSPDMTLRLADYNPDTVDVKDAFNLRNELKAFADLISSTSLKPPLSIGLFGNWGAGKSFFMRCLEDHVNRNAASKSEIHHDKVAQITFNAWHYMDANLWASLMTHILSELSRFVGNKSADEKKQQELFRQLEITKALKQEADCNAATARKELDGLGEKIKILEQDKAKAKTSLDKLTFKNVIQETLKDDKVQELLGQANNTMVSAPNWESLSEIERTYTELNSTANLISSSFKTLFDVKGRAFYYFLFFVLSFVVVAVIAYNFDDISAAYKHLIQLPFIVAGLGTAVGWYKKLQPVLKKIKEGSGYLRRAGDRVRELQKAAEQDYNKELAVLLQEYQRLAQEEQEAKRRQAEVESELKATLAEIKEIEKGKRLEIFLERRITSSDYSQHLGLIALLRNDLENLCKFLQASQDNDLHIDRIVLYIDDLDRCPPDKVVEVLQAVHLLLAFPLFVVVVGVDVRWIKHSLEMSLLGAAGKEGNTAGSIQHFTTSLDYLEKIFQIPYKLKRPDMEDKVSMLEDLLNRNNALSFTGLIGSTGVSNIAASGNETPGTVEDIFHGKIGEFSSELEAVLNPEHDKTYKADGTGFGEPLRVEITSDEEGYMKQVMGKVMISPRSLKRYVNTYKLIKANPDWRCTDEQGEFLYKETLYLLAISICCPRDMEIFTSNLKKYEEHGKCYDFHNAVVEGIGKANKESASRALPLPEFSFSDIRELYPESIEGELTTVKHLKRVIEVVERFSFSYS